MPSSARLRRGTRPAVAGLLSLAAVGLLGCAGPLSAPVRQSELDEIAGQLATAAPAGPYGLDRLPRIVVDRPEEQQIGRELARPSPAPLVVLSGGAGIGKAALTNKLAWDHSKSGLFADGVVRLGVHERATDDVLAELYKAVVHRPPPPALGDLVAALTAALRGKRLLVVLDDVGWEGERLPSEVSQALAETAVLATSRRRYSDPRVQLIELGNMTPPQSRQLLAGTISDSRRSAFSEAELDQLSERLGHNALALNLAAGVLSRESLSAASYLDKLAAVPPRPITDSELSPSLLAALELAFGSLSGSERAVLVGIGMLADAPVPPELLTAMLELERPAVETALDGLAELHLVERRAVGSEVSMHPLVHAWAQQKGEQTWFRARKRDRSVRRFLAMATALPDGRWGAPLTSHLQATQEWAIRDGKLAEAYQLAEAWHSRLHRAGPWSLWDRLWRNTVDSALRAQDRKALMRSLRQLALTRELAGYHQGAEGLYRESLQIARDLKDQRAVVETLNELGSHEQGASDGVAILRESIEQAQLLGDQALLGQTLELLGTAEQAGHDYVNADRHLQRALQVFTQRSPAAGPAGTDDVEPAVQVMLRLHRLELERKNLDAARAWLNKTIESCQRSSSPSCAAPAFVALGQLADQQGNSAEAERHFDRAQALYRQARDHAALAQLLHQLAQREEQRGELTAAGRLLQKGRDSAAAAEAPRLQLTLAATSAELAFRLRDLGLAEQLLSQALQLAARLGDAPLEQRFLRSFDYLRWTRLPLAEQLVLIRGARARDRQGQADPSIVAAELALARLERLQRNFTVAESLIAQAAQHSEAGKDSLGLALVLGERAGLLAAQGDANKARTALTRAQALCDRLPDEARTSCLATLAELATEGRQLAAASQLTEKRIGLLRPKGRPIELANATEQLAELAAQRGDKGAAQKRYQEVLGLWQKLHADIAVARVLERLAWLAMQRGDGFLASQWIQEAVAVGLTLDAKGETWARLRLLQAQLALRQKQKLQARTFIVEAIDLFEKLHAPELATAQTLLKSIDQSP